MGAELIPNTIALGSDVTGTLPVANGGTAGTTKATARAGINAQRRVVVLDQDVTCAPSSTAVADVNMAGTTDDGLTVFGFPVAANEFGSFEIVFRTTDTASPQNQKYGIKIPSGGAGHVVLFAVTIGGTSTYSFGGLIDSTGSMVNLNGTGSGGTVVRICGSYLNGGSAGNINLLFGQSTSSGTTFTIKKGAMFLISSN